jgi:hypothetical protein
VRNFDEDEGRPLEVGAQARASNRPELRGSRAQVVSVVGKGGRKSRQVRRQETNESEPLMKCRKTLDDVKTGPYGRGQDKPGGKPARCPGGIRHVGGVN